MNLVFLISLCNFLGHISAQNYNGTKAQINELKNEHRMLFGVSTAAYQIEGAWNESGKTESIWDRFVHTHPDKIANGSNADITCDSIHNIQRDINMLKFLGVDFYRFSISWPRVSPTPMQDAINEEGLKYYHNLIDQLIANNIKPIVTLYHYDLPQNIHDFGGWTNELAIDYFENYARIVFDNFADKVNIWVTFNKPDTICHRHYGTSEWPPEISSSGIADYLCLRNLFLAHARVYRLYKQKYDTQNKGMMGLNLDFKWFEPVSNATKDVEATDLFRKFYYGIQADPVYSTYGGFPDLLKTVIANKSREQGFHNSRLPELTTEEIESVRNTYDFMGISYFTPYQISQKRFKVPSFEDDIGDYTPIGDDEFAENTTISWLKNYPEGLREVLLYIKNTYDNPKVMILENGCGSSERSLENFDCVAYYMDHLDVLYDAVTNEGCNVQAYGVWSLMDSFEWDKGFTEKFGLFDTDFNDAKRSTKPKQTAEFFKDVLGGVKENGNTDESTKPDIDDNINGSGSLSGNRVIVLILMTVLVILILV